jgi:hypothetical protein
MTPIVRYMLLCDDVRIDPDKPYCVNIDCLMTNIVSLEEPPFPLVREMFCVYLVLTDCYGKGVGQIRVAYVDGEHEQLLFGSREHELDFTDHTPLEVLSVAFRIEACRFPRAGRYSVQFRYNQELVDEKPLLLR